MGAAEAAFARAGTAGSLTLLRADFDDAVGPCAVILVAAD